MGNAVAHLIIGRGPNPNQEYTLTQAQTTIGRGATNDLVLPDPEVSRRHAQIVRDADGYSIEDWGSTNGTFVNGQRITTRTPLEDGDEIDLGESISMTFLYMLEPTAQTPSAAADEEADDITLLDWKEDYPVETAERRTLQPDAPSPYSTPAYDAWEAPEPIPYAEPAPYPPTAVAPRPRRRLLGCFLTLLLLLFLCSATLYFLDWYQQGRLLYCGALRPFFEIVLGPFGFAPICP